MESNVVSKAQDVVCLHR